MTRRHSALALGLVTACLAAAAAASAEPAPSKLTGQVVDPGLYLREGAPGTVEQAYEALDGGQSLALLADNGMLYVLLAERSGEDPNELVYDYVNKRVNVTGLAYERGGVKGLVLQSVESLEPDEAGVVEAEAEGAPAIEGEP